VKRTFVVEWIGNFAFPISITASSKSACLNELHAVEDFSYFTVKAHFPGLIKQCRTRDDEEQGEPS
jgi:hypothetical protein